jgi:hypothetical protein
MEAYWLLPRSVELEFGQRCLFRPKRLDASPLIRLMGSYSGMVTTEKIRVMAQLEILCVLDARCSRGGLIRCRQQSSARPRNSQSEWTPR